MRIENLSRVARLRGYASDLNDLQWEQIEPFIPNARHGGRPRTTDERQIMNAILYVLRAGVQWRMLPREFPPWQTVYRYFRDWQKRGVFRRMQRYVYELTRICWNRETSPSAIVIDSQSVKTGKAGGKRGYDGGKKVKGRKRHVITDTLGYLVDVVVTPANVHDVHGARKVLTKAKRWLKKKPKVVFADKGYQGEPLAKWVRDEIGAQMQTSNNPAMVAKKFIPMKKRWVVERQFAWFGDYRRLDKDHERQMAHSTAFLRLSMVSFMLRQICPD
jgi:putative transposase